MEGWYGRWPSRTDSRGVAVRRSCIHPEGRRGEQPVGAITVAGGTVLVRQSVVTDEAPVTGIYWVPSNMDRYVTSVSGGSTCLGFSVKSTTTSATSATIVCGHLGGITVLEHGLVLVTLTDADGSQALVADTVAGTVTLLTVPPVVQKAALIGAVAETATSPMEGWYGRWPSRTDSRGVAVRRSCIHPEGRRGEQPVGAITVAGGTVLVRQSVVTDEAPVTGIYWVPSNMDRYVTSVSGGSTCLGFSVKSTTTSATSATIVCGHLGGIT